MAWYYYDDGGTRYYQGGTSSATTAGWSNWVTQTSSTTLLTTGTPTSRIYWVADDYGTSATTTGAWSRPIIQGQTFMMPSRTSQEERRRQQAMAMRAYDREERECNAELFRRERARQEAAFAGHAKAASAIADGLLMEHLTEEQRECFKANKWFIVEGGKSKKKYRIRGGTLVANIDALAPNDKVAHRLCAHAPAKAMPLGDHLLAQKMMLEFAEEDFLKVANRHTAYN